MPRITALLVTSLRMLLMTVAKHVSVLLLNIECANIAHYSANMQTLQSTENGDDDDVRESPCPRRHRISHSVDGLS